MINNMKNIEHSFYLNKETIKEEKTIKSKLGIDKYRLEELWDYKSTLCGMESLVAQPQYFNQDMIGLINEKHIECLYLEDRIIRGFFKKELDKYKTLTSLLFLKQITHLKCLKIDHYTSVFAEEAIVKIDDFSPIETLKNLECLHIYDTGSKPIFVDIDFFKLQKLKNFSLQFPKENKTIFKCPNIEEADTRYYFKDLSEALNWKKLKRFGAYFDKLKSFEGIEEFKYLEELKGEFTSSLQSFEGFRSKSIKTFYYYTEARKTPTTLQGIGGLENVELIKLAGLKKLESIGDLTECKHLKEFWLEESQVPDDIEEITKIKSLKKVFIDYPDKAIKKFPKLKPYME